MIAGLIGNIMRSTGEEGTVLANKGADYLKDSAMQDQAAEIARMRDARLAELQKENMRYGEELRRQPGQAAAAEVDRENAKPAYDEGTDSVRPKTPQEKAAVEEGAYRRQGLVSESLRARELEQQRQGRVDEQTIQRERLQSEDKYHNALLAIHQAAEGRLTKGSNLDNAIKEIGLKNNKRVEDLRTEFSKPDTAPDRKEAIKEEIQLLTGKDNDRYLPVPTKDEMGNITGYQVFDTKAGRWKTDAGGPGAQPTTQHIEALRKRANDPAAVSAFEAQFGKGSAARFLPKQPGPAPAPAPAAAPPAPRAEPPAAPAASSASPGDPGAALDAARSATAAARNKVQTYGLMQRRSDPAGYERAQEELQQAIAAQREAEQAWNAAAGSSVTAARMRPVSP